MGFFKYLLIKLKLKNNKAFIWNSENKSFKTIQKIQTTNLDLIVSLNNQKETLLSNTKKFASGNVTNNALLWGARGMGISSLV